MHTSVLASFVEHHDNGYFLVHSDQFGSILTNRGLIRVLSVQIHQWYRSLKCVWTLNIDWYTFYFFRKFNIFDHIVNDRRVSRPTTFCELEFLWVFTIVFLIIIYELLFSIPCSVSNILTHNSLLRYLVGNQ